jgi:hypothetical protein
MTADDRQSITCDYAFALYLSHASKVVNQDYYKVLTRFVMLYRQCLNEVGWQRRREHFIKCNIPLEEDDIYIKVLEKEGKKLGEGAEQQSSVDPLAASALREDETEHGGLEG